MRYSVILSAALATTVLAGPIPAPAAADAQEAAPEIEARARPVFTIDRLTPYYPERIAKANAEAMAKRPRDLAPDAQEAAPEIEARKMPNNAAQWLDPLRPGLHDREVTDEEASEINARGLIGEQFLYVGGKPYRILDPSRRDIAEEDASPDLDRRWTGNAIGESVIYINGKRISLGYIGAKRSPDVAEDGAIPELNARDVTQEEAPELQARNFAKFFKAIGGLFKKVGRRDVAGDDATPELHVREVTEEEASEINARALTNELVVYMGGKPYHVLMPSRRDVAEDVMAKTRQAAKTEDAAEDTKEPAFRLGVIRD